MSARPAVRRARSGVASRRGSDRPSTVGVPTAADIARPALEAILGTPLPVRFVLWDGSATHPDDGLAFVLARTQDAFHRILWAPGELGLGRAYVSGDIELAGDAFALLAALTGAPDAGLAAALRSSSARARSAQRWKRRGPGIVAGAVAIARAAPPVVHAVRRLGLLKPAPPAPAIEVSPAGRIHSKARDSRAVTHHYDIGNDFYRIVLGPSMTYSCGRFETDDFSLEQAQEAKNELICRKLGLHERSRPARFLDVGCGWGSLAIHAAQRHGARALGVTLSPAQVELGRARAKEAGLEHQVHLRLADYRDLGDARFDAISSVGMSEHVGRRWTEGYMMALYRALDAPGRLLNHAISSVGGSRMSRRSFVGRYVFPDGELLDVCEVVATMERVGFEVRDVESLREHYSKTLHAWVANLEAGWDAAVSAVGIERARAWRLYMVGSANGFDSGRLAVHQVLGVKRSVGGPSHMPATRGSW